MKIMIVTSLLILSSCLGQVNTCGPGRTCQGASFQATNSNAGATGLSVRTNVCIAGDGTAGGLTPGANACLSFDGTKWNIANQFSSGDGGVAGSFQIGNCVLTNTAGNQLSNTCAYDGGSVSFGAYGSSPNANGGVVSSGVITLEPASASFPGGVTTGTQTFAGDKTFSGQVTASNLVVSGGGNQILTVGNDLGLAAVNGDVNVGTTSGHALNISSATPLNANGGTVSTTVNATTGYQLNGVGFCPAKGTITLSGGTGTAAIPSCSTKCICDAATVACQESVSGTTLTCTCAAASSADYICL